MSKTQKVAILDAGAQYGKVIDRRVRELKVESELLPSNTPASELKKYQAIIISGGPDFVDSPTAPKFDPELFKLHIPVLGICYGMQLANYILGGTVNKKARREDGPCAITIETDSPLFQGLEKQQHVLMSHGATVDTVANGFRVTANSQGLIAGMENQKANIYCVQFHPEVDLTQHGKDMLSNFLYNIAGLTGSYSMGNREQLAIAEIQHTVHNKKVLVLVSGGIDSTVCATLLHKALKPSQIYAVHIDHGFMRLNESQKVTAALNKIGLKIQVVSAAQTFYTATTIINGKQTQRLSSVIAPEEKRKIIGDTFMKVTQKTMQDLQLDPEDVFFVQGTLRPDLIESASPHISKAAETIKTHHNDSQAVRELRLQKKVIEPLRDFHKDEVRALGKKLGLPEEIVWRQPFPGPGLAIRILCAEQPYITKEFEQIQKNLQQFATPEIAVTLLPVQTVGVQGDGRSYSYLVALSSSAKPNWPKLLHLAREIPKMVHQVNRVGFLFGEKLTKSVKEITPTHLTPDAIQQVQAADEIVNQLLFDHALLRKLSQVPVISFPVGFGKKGNRSIAIRTFMTNDFMTGVPATPGIDLPESVLNTMVERIVAEVPGISRVLYDLTSKPPGTTEWE